jgi:hypothetical protein
VQNKQDRGGTVDLAECIEVLQTMGLESKGVDVSPDTITLLWCVAVTVTNNNLTNSNCQ